MIVTIDWTTFHSKYFNQGTIFAKRDEKYWYLYTQDEHFIIKCVIEKEDEMEANIMFVERFFQGNQNILWVQSIHDESEIKINNSEDESGQLDPGASGTDE